MQYPGKSRVVTVIALVDFHEGKYTLPETATVLKHQVLAADNLGDDSFLKYICLKLNVPFGRVNGSNKVKMAECS